MRMPVYLRLRLARAGVASWVRLGAVVGQVPVALTHIPFASARHRRNGVPSLNVDNMKMAFYGIGVHLALALKAR
jgi:hypothetical protein